MKMYVSLNNWFFKPIIFDPKFDIHQYSVPRVKITFNMQITIKADLSVRKYDEQL